MGCVLAHTFNTQAVYNSAYAEPQGQQEVENIGPSQAHAQP